MLSTMHKDKNKHKMRTVLSYDNTHKHRVKYKSLFDKIISSTGNKSFPPTPLVLLAKTEKNKLNTTIMNA